VGRRGIVTSDVLGGSWTKRGELWIGRSERCWSAVRSHDKKEFCLARKPRGSMDRALISKIAGVYPWWGVERDKGDRRAHKLDQEERLGLNHNQEEVRSGYHIAHLSGGEGGGGN